MEKKREGSRCSQMTRSEPVRIDGPERLVPIISANAKDSSMYMLSD